MRRIILASILPIIEGLGYAIVEVYIQFRLGYFPMNSGSWFLWFVRNHPHIAYYIGMFIVLSTPWTYWRNFWLWLYSTTIAFWSEDVFYWVLIWEPPHSWGPIYIVWHGVPILYIPATALVALSLIMYVRAEKQ